MVDTNGDGGVTKPWNEPSVVRGARFEEDATASTYDFDPALDTRVEVGAYGIIVNPVDGSVWGAQDSYPGRIVRLVVGDDPPESCIAEVSRCRRSAGTLRRTRGRLHAARPRRHRDGVIWIRAAGTNRGRFDRASAGDGPAAHEGRHCAEGWTLYPLPGPTFKGTDIRADYNYYKGVGEPSDPA